MKNAPHQIDGFPGWWQPVTARYDYVTAPDRCPVCGGVGWVGHGWFTCDGACHAVAVVNTGQVFVPLPDPETVAEQTYSWEP